MHISIFKNIFEALHTSCPSNCLGAGGHPPSGRTGLSLLALVSGTMSRFLLQQYTHACACTSVVSGSPCPFLFLEALVQLVLLGNWVPYCPNIKLHHWVADSPRFCCAFGIAFSFAGNRSLAIIYSLGISRVLHMFQRPAFTPSQEKGCCGTPVLVGTLSLIHIPCALERPCTKLEFFCKGYFMNKSMNE